MEKINHVLEETDNGDAKTLKAFIEGLEKRNIIWKILNRFSGNSVNIGAQCAGARDARRVYTEANILEELDS